MQNLDRACHHSRALPDLAGRLFRVCQADVQRAYSSYFGLCLPRRRPCRRAADQGNELAPVQLTELHSLPLARMAA